MHPVLGFTHTPEWGYFFLHGITQEHVDQYVQKYYAEDVWKIAFAERNMYITGNVMLGDELIPRAQLLASKFYKECLSRNKNMVQLMTGIVFGMDSTTSVPAICSFFRGSHHPDFAQENIARMRLLLPHLSRSLGVMQRLQSAELTVATSLAALNRLSSGVLLIDSLGKVAFANLAAQRVLKNEDGLGVCQRNNTESFGSLISRNTECNKAINAALNNQPYNTPHFSKCVTVPRTSGLSSYTLQFSALGEHTEFGAGRGTYSSIIFISDDTQEVEIDPVLLKSAYGLTPAETRVALALLRSTSAQDVADQLGTSTNTVRSQIKQIYTKLGVDSRTRFVKLMLGLAHKRS